MQWKQYYEVIADRDETITKNKTGKPNQKRAKRLQVPEWREKNNYVECGRKQL